MTFLSQYANIHGSIFLLWINKHNLKTRKMLEGHVQVRQDIDMVITPFQIGLTC